LVVEKGLVVVGPRERAAAVFDFIRQQRACLERFDSEQIRFGAVRVSRVSEKLMIPADV